jgi:chemotaxis protein MotB
MADDPDASGISVYPRLPIPKGKHSDPKMPKKGGGMNLKLIGVVAAAAVLGLGVGYLAHRDGGGDKAKSDAAAAAKAASVEKDRADGLAAQLEQANKDKDAAEKTAADLSTKVSDAEKKASDAAAAKLSATIDKSQGSVSQEGDEIHLKLVDKVLFATGDDQLTDKGKAVLDKVAVALKDLPDKQVWVQGHTDDQPIYIPPAPKAPPAKKDPKAKAKKGAPEPAAPAVAPVRFATNWELSAARALNVVHYLQDTAKIDPTRLAALAFGQYRPVSRSHKSLNRRIEIVLVPKKAVLEKD